MERSISVNESFDRVTVNSRQFPPFFFIDGVEEPVALHTGSLNTFNLIFMKRLICMT